MRLKISHRTEYAYVSPVNYALQRVRLTPRNSDTQRILSWSIGIEGAREELRYTDHFRNETRLLSVRGAAHTIAIVAEGEVETYDTAGISGRPEGFVPLWLFSRHGLDRTGPKLVSLARSIGAGGEVDRLHGLMKAIQAAVTYEVGSTGAATTAEDALAQGKRRMPGPCAYLHCRGAGARISGPLCKRLPQT
jgi:transglutaminase-like putative cysteine protease